MTIDPIVNNESGLSVRNKLNSLINTTQGIEHVNTTNGGGTPVNCDVDNYAYTYVTTDGTNSLNYINLPVPTNLLANTKHTIVLATQTGEDALTFLSAGNSGIYVFGAFSMQGEGGSLGQITLPVITNSGIGISFTFMGPAGWVMDSDSFIFLSGFDSIEVSSVGVITNDFSDRDSDKGVAVGSRTGGVYIEHDLGAQNSKEYVNLSDSPYLATTAHISYISTYGSGTEVSAILSSPSDYPYIGLRKVIVYNSQPNGSDSFTLNYDWITDEGGNYPTGITFTASGQYLLLEAYDTNVWHIIRGTCNITGLPG